MTTAPHVALDELTRRTLTERFELTRDATMRLRCEMVLLAARDQTATQVTPLGQAQPLPRAASPQALSG